MKKLTKALIAMLIVSMIALNSLADEEFDDIEFDIEAITIHGFISQGYIQTNRNNFLAGNTEDGSFEFSEFGINFATDLSDRLHIGLQLFGRDLGNVGNNDITLDWAYADY